MKGTAMRTAEEIVKQTNELARRFYALRGYLAPAGFRFDQAKRCREIQAWEMACVSQRMLTDTDPMDALSEMEED